MSVPRRRGAAATRLTSTVAAIFAIFRWRTWFAGLPGRLLRRATRPSATGEQGVSSAQTRHRSTPRRRDLELSADRELIARDLDALNALLRDIRDATGADEAVFWKWVPERDRSVPYGWSTVEVARPAFFDVRQWGPLVRWAAEQQRLQLDAEAAVRFGAAPVASDGRFHGVLSLTSDAGLPMQREAIRHWLPRYALQLARLLALSDVRLDYGRQVRRNEQLLEAMKRLQEHKRAESLGPAICEHAIAVSSASAAALVRWVPDEGRGTVQFASQGLGVQSGALVGDDTLVSDACRAGTTLVLEDARTATAARAVYHAGLPARQVASLAVVPLVHDRRVIGAIVVEGDEPGDVTPDDAQILEVLGGSVHGSLEVVWEIEEVTRRAHTDALTGLANRRHFDEQLKAAVLRTDRSGSPCSLVLVDLDHFKAVNDTYGHEAGDAVLQHVARVLSEGIRAVDVCARYGGEEMAILLPDTASPGAAELAERLRSAIASRPVRHRGGLIQVTASFGVAAFPEMVLHGDSLFPAADKALYAAKSAGRNCVKVASARAISTKHYR